MSREKNKERLTVVGQQVYLEGELGHETGKIDGGHMGLEFQGSHIQVFLCGLKPITSVPLPAPPT